MKPMTAERLTMRLDSELKTWLEDEAKRQDRSASYIAKKAIVSMKERMEAKRALIEEAMAEADKGVFISEEKMFAWFESLGTENELPEPEPDIFLNQS